VVLVEVGLDRQDDSTILFGKQSVPRILYEDDIGIMEQALVMLNLEVIATDAAVRSEYQYFIST
jgi:hypothetical protein